MKQVESRVSNTMLWAVGADEKAWQRVVLKAVQLAGGVRALAKKLGFCERTIYRWKKGKMPLQEHYLIVVDFVDEGS